MNQSSQSNEPPHSFNPIVEHQTVDRFGLLWRRFTVGLGDSLVFGTARKGFIHVDSGRLPGVGELLSSGVHDVYRVDMGSRRTSIQAELPSADEDFVFHAEIDIDWRVKDARRVVIDGVTDIREVLRPALIARLCEVTRRFAVEASASAEDAANRELRSEPVGGEFGLEVAAVVRLSLDADVVRALTEEQRNRYRRSIADFVTQLLESDALDRWAVDDQVRTTLELLAHHVDLLAQPDQSAVPVTVYLPDGAIHDQVESAVQQLLASADLEVEHCEDPVRGGRLDG